MHVRINEKVPTVAQNPMICDCAIVVQLLIRPILGKLNRGGEFATGRPSRSGPSRPVP
jgi:hypothetical protein